MYRLGGTVLSMDANSSSVQKGETLEGMLITIDLPACCLSAFVEIFINVIGAFCRHGYGNGWLQ
jgi:hypothetical protein